MEDGQYPSSLLGHELCLLQRWVRNYPMFVSCVGWSSCSLLCHLFSLYQASTSHPDLYGNLLVAVSGGRGLSLPGPEIQRPG